jgi:hypothetical protein
VRIEAAESFDTGRGRYWRSGICGLLFFATTINYIAYRPIFLLAGTAYLGALLLIQAAVPQLEKQRS